MTGSGYSRNIFNKSLVVTISNQLKAVFSNFDCDNFIDNASSFSKDSGLKARCNIIADALVEFLPNDYSFSAKIIKSTFEPVKNNQNNWENFLFMPYAVYVEKKGCKKEYLEISFNLLKEITKRFTSEFSIRTFLINFPVETLDVFHKWVHDENPNVRRLVSESSRPKLPWANEIQLFKKNPYPCIELLQVLKNDDSKYVQKSVANHMNDISKSNPDIALNVLSRWSKENKPNINWIIKHALRNELKKGNKRALTLMKYSLSPKIILTNFKLNKTSLKIGDSLTFSFMVTNVGENDEKLMIDYICHYVRLKNKISPKIFNLKSIVLQKQQSITIKKEHFFKTLSTRKLYPGNHKISLRVNCKLFGENPFVLTLK